MRQYVYHRDSHTPVAFVEGGIYTPCRLTGGVRQSFRLADQYADGESGLYYNVGRYYASFVGQLETARLID